MSERPITKAEMRELLSEQASAIISARGMGAVGRTKHKHRRGRGKPARNGVLNSPSAPAQGQRVYVIGSPTGAIKIGISADPWKRLSELQTGHPHKLQLHFHTSVVADARSVELECHRRLASRRLSGEWFEVDAYEAVELVGSVASDDVASA